MKLTIFIYPEQFGHNSGSNFQIFLIHSRHVLEGIRGGLYSETSIMTTSCGTSGSGSLCGFRIPFFRLIPRLLLLYQAIGIMLISPSRFLDRCRLSELCIKNVNVVNETLDVNVTNQTLKVQQTSTSNVNVTNNTSSPVPVKNTYPRDPYAVRIIGYFTAGVHDGVSLKTISMTLPTNKQLVIEAISFTASLTSNEKIYMASVFIDVGGTTPNFNIPSLQYAVNPLGSATETDYTIVTNGSTSIRLYPPPGTELVFKALRGNYINSGATDTLDGNGLIEFSISGYYLSLNSPMLSP